MFVVTNMEISGINVSCAKAVDTGFLSKPRQKPMKFFLTFAKKC